MTKRNYLMIILAVAVVFIVCYFLQFGIVTSFGNQTAGFIKSPYIFIPAIVIAFALLKSKYYVWIMIISAIVVAYLESRFISTGAGNIMIVAAKSAAFLSITFILNFIRVLFK